MDLGRRESIPPARLHYTGPGQQSSIQLPGLSSGSSEPFTLYNRYTLEELEDLVATDQRIIDQCNQILERTTPIAQTYENMDEDLMSAPELEKWKSVRTEHNNAKVCSKQASDRIQVIRSVIKRKEDHSSACKGKNVEPSFVTKCSSKKTKSTGSSLTVRLKQVRLNAEKEAVALRHSTAEEIEKCEDEIERLQKVTPSSEDEASKLKTDVNNLRAQIEKLRKRMGAKIDRIQESAEVQVKELELDQEDEQGGISEEDLDADDWTRKWVASQQQFDESQNMGGAVGGLAKAENMGTSGDVKYNLRYDKAYYLPNTDYNSSQRQGHVSFQSPLTKDFGRQQQFNEPAYKTPTFHQTINYNERFRGPPRKKQYPELPEDKDQLMMQLLQTQLTLLQRPQGKDWEPKDLPQFDGKPEDWPIFKNELHRTTPTGKMNSSQNAIRLRKALTGTARETVIGLLNNPDNVEKIMGMLERRFGRNELIIDALIQKAENCRAPDINKPDTFVQFGIIVQQLVESLRSLDEATYLNDKSLQKKLISKLPILYASEWLSWIDMRPNSRDNLDSFGKWMESKMNNLMRLSKPNIKADEPGPRRTKRGTGIVNVASSDGKGDDGKQCAYCEKTNHSIHKCFSFKKLSAMSRIEAVKEKGLCFRCLEKGHSKRNCKSQAVCTVKDCKSTHHPLLHGDQSWDKKKKEPAAVKEQKPPDDVGKSGDDAQQSDGGVIKEDKNESTIGAMIGKCSKSMSICRVRVRGPKGIRKVYALLDSGSDSTVIDKGLSEEIGLPGKTFNHQVSGVGGTTFREKAKNVSFEISGAYPKADYYKVDDAITMNVIGIPPHTQDVEKVKKQWPYLRRARLESHFGVIPKIIIGEDNPFLSAHRNILERGEHEPMAKRTVLGWVLAGKLRTCTGNAAINVMTSSDNQKLEALLKENYSLESFGVVPSTSKGSVEDQRALAQLESTVKKVNGVWECGLLWRDVNVKLPESRPDAVRRLISNEKRMMRDKVLFDMYHSKIEEYMKKGYIAEMSEQEAMERKDRTFYIPHFPHFNINKPGKLRLVFDAAAKVEGVSLNDNLLTGPDFIRPLPAVLWNFRIHNIVIQGDVEDMFHRVMVRKKDRDSQRFVFRDLRKPGEKIKDYWMRVLIFGSCSYPATAIFVKNKNAEEYSDQFPEAVRAILEDFYSDDCLSGAKTVQEAIALRQQIYDINKAGNFYVKKWLSNSLEVINSVPVEDRAAGVKQINAKTEIPNEKTLGMWWNPVKDCFTFSTDFKKIRRGLLEGERPTKRELCSVLMSVFDPLGLIGNLKIKGMILLQRSWKSGIDWDDHVTDEIFTDWRTWLGNLQKTEDIEVPRCYCYDIHLAASIELHTMVDSSEEACAAICFLRVCIGEEVSLSFVSAKVKVAPVKKLTIPRLELLAAVIGVSLAHTITSELRVSLSNRVFWSDSRTVLLWIRTETLRYKEFVANKISRIHELSNVSEWRWVPTDLNVADQGTRIREEIKLHSESLWLKGPDFLRLSSEHWPKESKDEVIAGDPTEVKQSLICALSNESGAGNGAAVVMERFSSFTRMVRAQAVLMKVSRFWVSKIRRNEIMEPVCILKAKLPSRNKSEDHQQYLHRIGNFIRENANVILEPQDIIKAENFLICQVQREAFQSDYKALEKGVGRKLEILRKLSPCLQDGIIRLSGRIGAAQAPEDMKCPVILPGRHYFTDLLIAKEHELNAHHGQLTVLNNLRQKYWIIDGKAAVRRVFKKCLVCRIKKVSPVVPKMGELPYYRLSHGQPPFTFTGMDLFGPLEVTVARHREKRWVCLFTCMVTRAIHLEVVYGLSTDETMLALSRFIDQRGRPKYVYSDNGTNFVGAKRSLKESWEELDWSKIRSKYQQIEWKFTPPCSPHFGGAWERMVQAVKKVLKQVLKEKYPKDQILLTVLKGAENIVNSRPLSTVSDDPGDPSPLTPNHFIRGFCDLGPSIVGEFGNEDEYLRMQWRKAQLYLDIFWERWTKEVLPNLAQRQKWHDDVSSLGVGDLVFIVDDQQPRNTWSRGFISSTFPGKDGQIRVVEVTTFDVKNNRKAIYKRGVDKVCPLGLTMGKSN